MATNRCRNTVKVLDCGSELENEHTVVYEPFDVCLPFGRKLIWDGQGLRLQENVVLADGQYGLITVENGCITDASAQPVCEYTAQPCTPAASACGDGSGSISLQPGADNLLNYDASGRLGASINYETSTAGLSITGHGTVASPLVINYTPGDSEKTYLQSGTPTILPVSGSGSGTDPYFISHAESALGAGTYGNFTIDAFGHVTGYAEQTLAVTSVVAGDGLVVSHTGTIYTVGMERKTTSGTYRLGGYDLTFDGQGTLSGRTQVISLPVNPDTGIITYDPTYTTFTFNEYGNLIGTTARADVADDQFAEVFYSGRTSTAMTAVTTKSAYFKITYRGRLTVAMLTNQVPAGYGSLPSPYTVTINGRQTGALAHYVIIPVPTQTGTEMTVFIDEIVVITDAYYGAGSYTVSINCSTEDFTFPDNAIMTVELIARS